MSKSVKEIGISRCVIHSVLDSVHPGVMLCTSLLPFVFISVISCMTVSVFILRHVKTNSLDITVKKILRIVLQERTTRYPCSRNVCLSAKMEDGLPQSSSQNR